MDLTSKGFLVGNNPYAFVMSKILDNSFATGFKYTNYATKQPYIRLDLKKHVKVYQLLAFTMETESL